MNRNPHCGNHFYELPVNLHLKIGNTASGSLSALSLVAFVVLISVVAPLGCVIT